MERSPRSGATAAQVLAPSLRRGVADLRTADSDIRLDRAAGVHEFRVAARRLRSVLICVDAMFDSTDGIEAGLRAAGRAAGAARDTDVLRRRLVRLLADEPPVATALFLRERLDRELEGLRRRHWLELVDYLDSPTYDGLARRLDGFTDLTPWSPVAMEPADSVLPVVLDRQRHRFDALAQRVEQRSPRARNSTRGSTTCASGPRPSATSATPSNPHWASRPGRSARRCAASRQSSAT